jgi:hypothetical protein
MRRLVLVGLIGCASEPAPVEPGEPALRVDTPAAGAWLAPGAVTVSGQALGLSDLRLGDAPIEVVDGRFSTAVTLDRGVHAIEVTGADDRGDPVFRRSSVIVGEFASAGVDVKDGVAVQVTQAGLDTVLVAATGLVDVPALVAQLQAGNPVVSDSLLGVPYTLDLASLTLDPIRLSGELGDGVLSVRLVVDDLATSVRAQGAFGLLDTSVSASVDRITADVDVSLSAAGGALGVSLGPVSLDVDGFAFDASLIPGSFEDEIPFLSDMLREFIIDFAEDQLRVLVPTLVASLGDALSLSFELPIGERTFSVEGQFRTAQITPGKAVLGLDLGVGVDAEVEGIRYAGWFTSPPAPHALSAADPISLSLHDDLLNRILFEAWRGGLLNLALTTDDEPLLGLLFAQLGSTEGSIVVDAKLPPVAVQGPEGLEVQFGEIDLTIATPGGTYGELVRVRIAGAVPVAPKVTDGALGVSLGEPVLSMMVVETDWPADEGTITNLLLSQLPIDQLLGIASAIDVPLPALLGLTIQEATAVRAASGVHTTVGMTLALEAP